MNKILKFTARYFLVIFLVLISGCNTYMSVYSDFDRTVNFSNYKTFAWLPDRDSTNTAYNNQIVRSNIRNYFSYAFAERGYKINVDSPDVFLDLIVTNVKVGEYVDIPVYKPIPSWYFCNPYYQPCPPLYYYRYPYYYDYSVFYVTQYREYVYGSITLNVIDRDENKLVWTGTAKGNLYDPEYAEDNIHPSVYKIISKYPVKPVKVSKP